MIKEILYCSHHVAEEFIPNKEKNYAAISVVGTPFLNANIHPDFKKILHLKFDDIQKDHEDSRPGKRECYGMTDSDALKVLNLYYECQESIESWNILVHCWAGIYRSGGIARYLRKLSNLNHYPNIETYNNFVYFKLLINNKND